jgi:uncharacterized protein involved in high-affinity Fe2+ transport
MTRPRHLPARLAIAGAMMALVAGCASANKTASSTTSAASAGASMSGMNMATTGSGASGSGSAAAVDGIKPVPTQTLATADWQGMKVSARAMTAVPFVVFNGTKEQMVKPPKDASFHLMVMLNDAHSGYPIPYAGVWATIRRDGKIVYDERQWPMISEYMGPHYGNNVALPGKGTYQLSLLISPPVSARHVEYENVWLKPHRVNVSFNWAGNS